VLEGVSLSSFVEPERIQEVVERLSAIPDGVVREVVGPYDVVIELEIDTSEDLTGILRPHTWSGKDVSGLGKGHTGVRRHE
jgi:hypothetical protein